MRSLLPEPAPTLLPANPDADAALAEAVTEEAAEAEVGAEPAAGGTALGGWTQLQAVAARFPAFSAAWARLAERALLAGDPVAGYAYARTGYHRGLDQLRRNGWRGAGPVPWSHEPNRGFLRSVDALRRAAVAIGEADEAARCADLLRDCDPAAAGQLGSGSGSAG